MIFRSQFGGNTKNQNAYARSSAIPDFLGMKYIAKLVLVVATLAFASCAHRDTATQTTQTTTSTGYRK